MGENTKDPLLQRIWMLRKKARVSQRQMADCLKIGQTTYSAMERGQNEMLLRYIPKIAKALNVQTWELFVDYQKGEVGPLSDQEKRLIAHFRGAKTQKQRKTIQDIAEDFSKS